MKHKFGIFHRWGKWVERQGVDTNDYVVFYQIATCLVCGKKRYERIYIN
jgi:hypothetical protein